MTPFETVERKIRDQLGRMLAGGGFDSAIDIQAITVRVNVPAYEAGTSFLCYRRRKG
jgi:hypothetical protein